MSAGSDPTLVTLAGGAILGSLVLYALLGGADYGGGLWDLLASGPRARRQRLLIERSIAPVWEANHVWLIVAVVVLMVGFPAGFSAISVALHVPLTLMLLGIVLRGTSFTFRHYDTASDTAQARWGRLFALASVFTPVLLGITLGAVSAGSIRLTVPAGGGVRGDLEVTSGLFGSWLHPLTLCTGLFALALFAFLAAVFLTIEAGPDTALAEDFRRRALYAGVAVGGLAVLAALAAGPDSVFGGRLLGGPLTLPIQAATAVAALSAFAGLWRRRYPMARAAAITQVTLILVGWAVAQHPYLIAPDLTLAAAAAPDVTLRLLLLALGLGVPILGPALYWLLRVFKREPAFSELDAHDHAP